MSQILDLSKIYTASQIEEAKANDQQYEDVPAGLYICKVVDAILNNDGTKMNISLSLDIDEGNYKGYFQKLEDRAGFWGLKGYMSFKESQVAKFLKACTAFNNSNPGFSFDPMRSGGVDVDSLKGKLIGVVIQHEEYLSKDNTVKEKCTVYSLTEVSKIKAGKIKIPELKKLNAEDANKASAAGFMNIPDGKVEELPFT